jgi:hypothetical protein
MFALDIDFELRDELLAEVEEDISEEKDKGDGGTVEANDDDNEVCAGAFGGLAGTIIVTELLVEVDVLSLSLLVTLLGPSSTPPLTVSSMVLLLSVDLLLELSVSSDELLVERIIVDVPRAIKLVSETILEEVTSRVPPPEGREVDDDNKGGFEVESTSTATTFVDEEEDAVTVENVALDDAVTEDDGEREREVPCGTVF